MSWQSIPAPGSLQYTERFSEAFLDSLRSKGDPLADAVIAELAESMPLTDVGDLLAEVRRRVGRSPACAVPENVAWMLSGMRICCSARWIASTAWPSETFGAVLNESVTAGNWPWCVMQRGVGEALYVANVRSGTCTPPRDRT